MCAVTPQTTDRDGVRNALIDAAAKLIAAEGPSALTLRRVAQEVGTSTMAVYTGFGGMPELRRAVRHEGFERLARELERAAETDDPVADLWMLGALYYTNALRDPELYRVAFMEEPLEAADAMAGTKAFRALTAGVERCIAAGRFAAGEPAELATEFWALGHGVISLQLAQLISPDDAAGCLDRGVRRLFEGWGDDPDSVERSLSSARDRARRATATA
jgi:AcrR family transcriptional regulator